MYYNFNVSSKGTNNNNGKNRANKANENGNNNTNLRNKRSNTKLKYKIKFKGVVNKNKQDITKEVQNFAVNYVSGKIIEENLESIVFEGRIDDEKIEKYLLLDVYKKLKECFSKEEISVSKEWSVTSSYCQIVHSEDLKISKLAS